MIRTKLYHKGRVYAATIMLLLAVGMTGCGKDTGAAEQPEEITTEADKAVGEEEKRLPEKQKNKDTVEEEPEADQKGQDEPQEEETEKEKEEEEALKENEKGEQTEPEMESQPQAGMEELTGNVSSVGADSFKISKITTEHHGDYDLAVSVAPGASGEELITVYVTDTTVYQYKTVKNGGINPEDISSREGSYGDLQEGLVVILKGRWEKDAFYADELVIEKFI